MFDTAIFLVIFIGLSSLGWLLLRGKTAGQMLPDMSGLGFRRQRKLKGTAVVCGGSISGILSARVCASHFENVVLVDPEFTRALDGGRKGRIMQYYSSHAFHNPFTKGLRLLWPNIDERVKAVGGFVCPADIKHYFNGRLRLPPWRTGDPASVPFTYVIRRQTMELVLEKLLLQTCPNVRIIDGNIRSAQISDSQGTSDSRTVQSLQAHDLSGAAHVLENPALVVDCSGASRCGEKWLKSAGYDISSAHISTYDPHMKYATIHFPANKAILSRLPIPGGYESSPFWYSYTSSPEYGENKAIQLTLCDDNVVLLIFGGWGDVDLPHTTEQIQEAMQMKFVQGWAVETVRILAESTKPHFELVKIPPCTWTHFEQVADLPTNLVVLGDAAMKVNPLYGHGAAKATLSSAVLNDLLTSCSSENDLQQGFSKQYFKRMVACNKAIWMANKDNDYAYDTTTPASGETLAVGKLSRWLTMTLMSAATENEEVACRLGHIIQLVEPISALLSFQVVYAIIKEILIST